MIRKPITIGISNGLEARPIALLVQVASQYASSIYLENEEKRVNAKSIMGIITLGATYKSKLTLICDGKDEELAADAIEKLFMNRFES